MLWESKGPDIIQIRGFIVDVPSLAPVV